uniref:Uncharacterized protein n=1 Tax=Coccolithus braarudii TaxID=221442 RepID=A0A7S0Q071_9EUKA|mmetsp:Transcript_28027/g.60343  ORF Transcript_28027/g.60343 Transcript_28027/m.60343 type:complete len:183 (+) Transcript_28027:35-583(+)
MIARIALLALTVPVAAFHSTADENPVYGFFNKFFVCQSQNSVPCLFETGVFAENVELVVRDMTNKKTQYLKGYGGTFDFFCEFWSRFSDPTLLFTEGAVVIDSDTSSPYLIPATYQVLWVYTLPTKGIEEESITWTLDPTSGAALSVIISYTGEEFIKEGDPGYFCEDPSKVDGLQEWLNSK